MKFLSCFSSSLPAKTIENDLTPPPQQQSKTVLNSEPENREQHVIVMRHGDRIDHAQPRWVIKAKRPWDPPLLDEGKARAFSTGTKLLMESNNLPGEVPISIHRVFVSPFIRCIETASEVVSAFCAAANDNNHSMLKVSIEYGLCEMLNGEAIRPNLAPKKGEFDFNLLNLEAMFPARTVDHEAEPVYQKLPRWEESVMDARARYELVIRALSDKYPSENLLIVTHGEGVRVAVSAFVENTVVHDVENCAYAHLRRQISISSSQKMLTAGKFEVLTKSGQSGIHFCPLSDVILDV